MLLFVVFSVTVLTRQAAHFVEDVLNVASWDYPCHIMCVLYSGGRDLGIPPKRIKQLLRLEVHDTLQKLVHNWVGLREWASEARVLILLGCLDSDIEGKNAAHG